MNKFKEKLKSFKLVYKANSKAKNVAFKRLQKKQLDQFNSEIKSQSVSYNEAKEISHFQQRLDSKNFTPKQRMTVLWIGTDENQDKSGFLQGLSKFCDIVEFIGPHGHYGQEFPIVEYDENVQIRNGQKLIEFYQEISKSQKIDFVMGQILSCYINKDCLLKLSHLPIINISMDDRLPHLWKKVGGLELGAAGLREAVDLTLTTCSDMCVRYSLLGMPSLFWPLASDPEVFYPKEIKDIDISFVGNKYGVRDKIISYLINKGLNIEAYGKGWPRGRIDHHKAPDIFNRSKIILGIGTVAYTEDIFTIKLRDFDAVMAGSLYITHRNPDLEKIFIEGEEIEFYKEIDELYQKLKKLLQNPQKIAKIGKQARQKAIQNYTWDIKFKHLLEIMRAR